MKKPSAAASASQSVTKEKDEATPPQSSIGPPNGSNILRPGKIDEEHAKSAFKKPSGEIKIKGKSMPAQIIASICTSVASSQYSAATAAAPSLFQYAPAPRNCARASCN